MTGVMKGGSGMKTYIVYRFDYIGQIREPVGKVVERRTKERWDNEASLLKLAQKLYPTPSPNMQIGIALE
jgi:hypothetical protein